ncbi:MAG: GntR family transcriptional regulator [Actinomycetia bacterium]|nr:GntR family transcriptional regulator [Actinomycetes bacterium]
MARRLRAVSLGDQLAEILRAQIVEGDLAAGTHLVEDTLASDHDVSRGPVRDAIKTLMAEGWLESRRRGFFVRELTATDITELYQIREAAEQLASALAIERAAASDWERAESLVVEMTRAADDRDRHAFAVADLAFHSEFYELSGNTRLLALWRQFQPTFAALLDVTNRQDADLHPSATDHRLLLDAAQAGDLAALSSRLGTHLAGSRRRMVEALQSRHPT